jgi:serine O-acetyltransferase
MALQFGRDIKAIKDRDPAARSWAEIILVYPGLHAVWSHRLAHWLWNHKLRFIARLLSSFARLITSVDIHPGATIGSGLFIDHAIGVVIGETTIIGNDVTLYQGVTLGGTSLAKGKRHPTLGDGVIVGSGAKVLGPIEVGHGARIGANSVVVRDVPEGAVVVGVPGQVISRSQPVVGATAVDADQSLSPDPVGSSLQALLARIEELEQLVTGSKGAAIVGPAADGLWRGEDFSI